MVITVRTTLSKRLKQLIPTLKVVITVRTTLSPTLHTSAAVLHVPSNAQPSPLTSPSLFNMELHHGTRLGSMNSSCLVPPLQHDEPSLAAATSADLPLHASAAVLHVPTNAQPSILTSSSSLYTELHHGTRLGSMNSSCPVPPLQHDEPSLAAATSADLPLHASAAVLQVPFTVPPSPLSSSPSIHAELHHGTRLGSTNSSCLVPPLQHDEPSLAAATSADLPLHASAAVLQVLSTAQPSLLTSPLSLNTELHHGTRLESMNSKCPMLRPQSAQSPSNGHSHVSPSFYPIKRKFEHLESKKTTPLDLSAADSSPRKHKIPRLASPPDPPIPPNPP